MTGFIRRAVEALTLLVVAASGYHALVLTCRYLEARWVQIRQHRLEVDLGLENF